MPHNAFGHPATGKAPAYGAKNAAAGYFWSGDDSFYTYSTSGGTVSVAANTPSTGIYQVSFDGLQSINDTGDVQVSGVFDYSWVYSDAHSGNLTGLGQYNSAHETNRVKHLGTGRYQVTFPGPRSSGMHGTVDVTPFGSGGGNCVLAGWTGSKSGEVVNVDCYSPAGKPENREFDVLYASTSNVLGLNRDVDANALFSGRSGITSPAEHYYSTRGAGALSDESPTGFYGVALPGSGGEYPYLGGDPQVNAVSTRDYHCNIEYWSQSEIPVVSVECFNSAGDPVSTSFVVQWMVPDVLIV